MTSVTNRLGGFATGQGWPMKLSTNIQDLTTSAAADLDRLVASTAEKVPAPGDTLVRRVGAVGVEALHQSGRITATTIDVVDGVVRVVVRGVSSIEDQASGAFRDSARIARDTGRRITDLAEDAGDAIGRNLRVVGDTADRVEDRVEDAVESGSKTVVRSVDKGVEEALESGVETDAMTSWTKDELYEKAQALDIEGRSSMSKDELVAAIRSA